MGCGVSRPARLRWCRAAVLIALVIAFVCGCASLQPVARELSAMPTERDAKPTPEAQRLLRQATIDFKRVLAGQYPIHATFKSAPRAGTRIYTHSGYTIADSALLLAGDDRMFHQSGVTLTLQPPITDTPVSFRDVRLTRRSLASVLE